MSKRNEVKALTKAVRNVKLKKVRKLGSGGNPPEAYRFKPGQSGNPAGRTAKAELLQRTVDAFSDTAPPDTLCAQVGIAPGSTWVETILFALGKAAAQGD